MARTPCMASRRWLRGQSDVTVSLSAPRLLTTLGASRSTGPFDEVRRVYGDFATALGKFGDSVPPQHSIQPRDGGAELLIAVVLPRPEAQRHPDAAGICLLDQVGRRLQRPRRRLKQPPDLLCVVVGGLLGALPADSRPHGRLRGRQL